jgi:hypothetical protein
MFEMSSEAAHKNYCILKTKFNNNINQAILPQMDSPLGYGSEFQKSTTLAPLLHLHPNWTFLNLLLNKGSSWPLDAISNLDRQEDVKEALTFGNHKGATNNHVLLESLVNNNVVHGFALPLLLPKIKNIKGALLAPLNIQAQHSINEMGRIVVKDCLTHNQSYKWTQSQMSVNSRTKKDKLLPCVYGGVVRRLVNWAVTACRRYPTTRIYATKIDIKSAYHRLHVNAKVAAQCCTQLPHLDITLMTLCLTFGGALCPFKWGMISETMCNLATAIILNND